jgi:hypothetical protein
VGAICTVATVSANTRLVTVIIVPVTTASSWRASPSLPLNAISSSSEPRGTRTRERVAPSTSASPIAAAGMTHNGGPDSTHRLRFRIPTIGITQTNNRHHSDRPVGQVGSEPPPGCWTNTGHRSDFERSRF